MKENMSNSIWKTKFDGIPIVWDVTISVIQYRVTTICIGPYYSVEKDPVGNSKSFTYENDGLVRILMLYI